MPGFGIPFAPPPSSNHVSPFPPAKQKESELLSDFERNDIGAAINDKNSIYIAEMQKAVMDIMEHPAQGSLTALLARLTLDFALLGQEYPGEDRLYSIALDNIDASSLASPGEKAIASLGRTLSHDSMISRDASLQARRMILSALAKPSGEPSNMTISHVIREAIEKCDGEGKDRLLDLGAQAIVKNPAAKELEKAVASLTADLGAYDKALVSALREKILENAARADDHRSPGRLISQLFLGLAPRIPQNKAGKELLRKGFELIKTHAMESPEHMEIAAKGIALANERALIYRGKVRQMMALFDEINKLPGSLREKSIIAEAYREYKETTGVFDDFVDIDGIRLPVKS